MHIEILVEDASGAALSSLVVPKILGPLAEPHTWRIHPYKGIGRVPSNLTVRTDPAKRILLQELPRLIRGYGRNPGVDAVVVLLDSDKRDCSEFISELNKLATSCEPRPPRVLFRLAIEEVEAWYFGDRSALIKAYPRAKQQVLDRYVQDTVCGTWEMLADAIFPGGRTALQKAGWPLPGQLKNQWAKNIGPNLDIEKNGSPSFAKLRDGLRNLTLS
jgi:hypothetical protein